jgi:hypothetical protein
MNHTGKINILYVQNADFVMLNDRLKNLFSFTYFLAALKIIL